MQAGFIGLGTMGASMAANLQKGLKARGDRLVVHDIRREAAARHVKDGAPRNGSAAPVREWYKPDSGSESRGVFDP